MNHQSEEQTVHDRVNLFRLVRRLESTICNDEWCHEVQTSGRPGWIKAQGTVQKVKYARKLLQTVEQRHDPDAASSSANKLEDTKRILDQLEARVTDISQLVAPKPSRPTPILPSIPRPVLLEKTNVLSDLSSESGPDSALLPVETPAVPSTSDFLLSSISSPQDEPQDIQLFNNDLLPVLPSKPMATHSQASSTETPAYLQNSTALHEELSGQLAQMAAQLRRNAQHFASSLEKDKSVVEAAQEKLERNHDVMTKERTRLRDHSSKSWGTTWITLLSIIVAMVGFILTFFVIRIT